MANFKKVLAAVLSAAMVFTLAPVGATNVQAAAKASAGTTIKKLSVTKTTLKVGASRKVKVTISKKQAANLKVSLKSSKKAVATVASSVTIKKGKTAANFTIKAKKAGKTNVTVSFKAGNKTVKKTIKVTVKAVETNDDNVDVTDGKITLVDQFGLQTDGTGYIGDTLRVDIPQTLGTMASIIWYRDGGQIVTTSIVGVSNTLTATSAPANTMLPGKYYAIATTSKGTTYKSNEITLTEKETAAVIKDFSIENDYEDGDSIDYASTDDQAVVSVTINKDYPGTIRLYKKGDSKYGTPACAESTTKATGFGDAWASTLPAANTVINQATVAGVAGTKIGSAAGHLKYRNLTTGEVTYKCVVSLQRGTEYVVTFDQDSITTDTPSTGKANVYDKAVEAPYVTAPDSIAITKVSNGNKPEITFYNKDKAVMSWMDKGTGNTNDDMDAVGMAEAKVYYATYDTTDVTKGTSLANFTLANEPVAKGTWTVSKEANDKAYWFAVIKTKAGIFGKDAITLASASKKTAQDAATSMTLKQNKDTATTATVSFANLRTDGKLYIIRTRDKNKPTANSSQIAAANLTPSDALENFKESDSATYEQVVEVKAGALTVDVASAIAPLNDAYASLPANNGYLAVFVPTDSENYGQVSTDSTATIGDTSTWAVCTKDPEGKAAKNYGCWIKAGNAKYSVNAEVASGIRVCTNSVYVIEKELVTTGGAADANVLNCVDQFGNPVGWDTSTAATFDLTKTSAQVGNATLQLTISATGSHNALKTSALPVYEGETWTCTLANGQKITLTGTFKAPSAGKEIDDDGDITTGGVWVLSLS